MDLLVSFSLFHNRWLLRLIDETVGFDRSPMLQSYTPRMRLHRKLMHIALNQTTVQRDVWPLQEKETRIYLNGLLDRPEAFLKDLVQ